MHRFIERAIEQGTTPRKTPTESVILRDGQNYRVLVSATGNLTKAGKVYQERTGEELESYSYDPQQIPRRVGNVEMIKMRGGGKEKVVRTFDPATGEFGYSQLGKRFYKDTRREYIVKIPAKFVGVRANGRPYERNGFFPQKDPVSVRMTWNRAQRDATRNLSDPRKL